LAGYKLINTSGLGLQTDNEGISIPVSNGTSGLRTAGVPTGSLIFSTSDNQLYSFNGTSWVKSNTSGTSGSSGTAGTSGSAGTSGTSPTGLVASNYLVRGTKQGGAQTIPNATDTVVTFGDNIDPNNWLTSNKIQPTISGYYTVNAQVWWDAGSVTNNQTNIQFRKNGNTQVVIAQTQILSGQGYAQSLDAVIYFNGSTDYIELTAYTGNPTSQGINSAGAGTWIEASLIVGGGTSGSAGTSGSSGSSGTTGTSGTSGITGPQGPQGPNGPQGFTGPQGAIGPQGIVGPQGTGGSSGTAGTSGSSGTAGTSGSSGTAGTSGSAGTSGGIGPQGNQGPIGPQGNVGPQGVGGPQGNQGPAGSSGTSGSAGTSGGIGPQGNQGPQGVQGPSGSSGTSGGIGPQGNQGPQGNAGPQGSTGPQGPTGPQGSTGPQGPAGPQGNQGPSGSSGTAGTSGTSPASQISGSGVSGQVAFFNGTSSIASEANFTWDSSTNALSVEDNIYSYRRYNLYFNDNRNLAAQLYEDGASTNGGTLTLYGKASGTIDTVISAAPTKLNYINNAANFMVGWNTDQGVKFAANGSGLFSGDLQVGSSNVASVSLRITRTNSTVPADANYFVASANTPNHSWIEGGYFTGELAGVITAPNSGYPYFENWAGQGSVTSKSFGFVNKTSGTFVSTDFLYTLSLLRTGQVKFNQYGSGTFTGTVAYNLAVDSSGNVIETAGGVVDGSGTANKLAKWSDSNTLTNANVTDDGSTVRINTLPLLADSRLGVGTAGGDQTYASIFIGGALTSGTSQYALLCDPQLAGTDNYAVFANARIKANTAVTNTFGVYIPTAEKLSGATIANNYALYIANQTSGSSSNYSIYSSGGLNYFGGIVGIGATPVSGISLYIKGNGVDSPLLKMQGFENTTAMLGDTTTGTTDVGVLWLYNQGTLRVKLSSSTDEESYINAGNFIVGSTSGSGYKVEFFGGNEDILRIHNTTTTGDSLIAFTNADGTLGRIQAVDGGGFIVDTPGIDRTNFLIGLNSTTIPNNAAGRGNLVVNGSSSSIMQMTIAGSEKGYVYHSGTGMQVWNTANGDVEVGANNSPVGYFKAVSSGSRAFVVGEPSALATASNRANITLNGGSNSILAFGVNNSLKGYLYNNGVNFYMNTGAGDLIFENDVATPLILNSNGFVGVRTTPLYQFAVNGSSSGIDFETNNNSTSATSILYTIRETGVSRTITTGGYTYGSSNPLTMVLTQSSNTPIGMYLASDNAEGAGIKGYKSRGTVAAPVSVNNGDTIFSMEGWAFHGSGPNQAKFGAGIRFVKEDAFGTANTYAPQRIEFYNAVSTTAVQTNAIIYPNGNTTFGSSTYYSGYKLAVEGNMYVYGGNATVKNTGNYGGFIADTSTATGGGYFSAYQNGTQIGLFGVAGAISGSSDSDVGIFAEGGKGIKYFVGGSGTASHIMTSEAAWVSVHFHPMLYFM
jgi:hypothetical protein